MFDLLITGSFALAGFGLGSITTLLGVAAGMRKEESKDD